MKNENKMRTVGILGNMGSGKSYVSGLLEKMDYVTIDLDTKAKHLYGLEEVRMKMIQLFGKDIYKTGKKMWTLHNTYELDKVKLASIIFSDDSKRIQLEKMLKPYLMKELYDDLYEYDQKEEIVFIESATMMKTGLYKNFDEIIVVYADYKDRLEMTSKHRNIDPVDFDNRNKMQIQTPETIHILRQNNIKYTVFHNKYDNNAEKFILEYLSI